MKYLVSGSPKIHPGPHCKRPALLARIVLFGCATSFWAHGSPAAEGPSEPMTVQTLETPDGVRFSLLGAKPGTPSPTLLVLALDAESTLSNPKYLRCGNVLAEQGYLCVSVDLPSHGAQQRGDEPGGIDGWRKRIDSGENPMTDLSSRLSRVLDHLVARGFTDPDQIVACGTSRGGYAALYFASGDPRVKAVAAYSPVTNLSALREFQGARETEAFRQSALNSRIESLSKIPVWIMIGDRDQRVGTDAAIAFARALSSAAAGSGLPGKVELHVTPSDGHHTPPGAEELSAAWMLKQIPGTEKGPR